MKKFPVGTWIRNRRIVERLGAWFRDEKSTEKLALSIALGFVLGVFPLLGIPTLLCGLAAALWRLNFPALQLMNYLAWPVQLALLWPFTRLGDLLFGVSHGLRGIVGLSEMAIHVTAAWCCFAVPAVLILYFTLRRLLRWSLGRVS